MASDVSCTNANPPATASDESRTILAFLQRINRRGYVPLFSLRRASTQWQELEDTDYTSDDDDDDDNGSDDDAGAEPNTSTTHESDHARDPLNHVATSTTLVGTQPTVLNVKPTIHTRLAL
jgi:hypothetical protein